MANKVFTAPDIIKRAHEYGIRVQYANGAIRVGVEKGRDITARITNALAKIDEYKPVLLDYLKFCCTTCGVHSDDMPITANMHFTANGVPYCDDHLPPVEDVRVYPCTSEISVQFDAKCIYCGVDAEYHSPTGTGWCLSCMPRNTLPKPTGAVTNYESVTQAKLL